MEKSSRPVRNRRHSRRAWPPGDIHRPVKRLFTPEIKRLLKDWLVRRRDNPYPSRDEKKALAVDTGLTYTQICNWFANWRRKLKNSGREPSKKTWGHLIKNYNTNAKGNVEQLTFPPQFSICSSDSIWGDDEKDSQLSHSPLMDCGGGGGGGGGGSDLVDPKHLYHIYNNNSELYNRQIAANYGYHQHSQQQQQQQHSNGSVDGVASVIDTDYKFYHQSSPVAIIDHCYTPKKPPLIQAQCFQISSTTSDEFSANQQHFEAIFSKNDDGNCKLGSITTAKYKSHIMEKYLRGLDDETAKTTNCGPELSKWLESTANFTPNKNNYIDWNKTRNKAEKKSRHQNDHGIIIDTSIHQKEELDAAEALTRLAGNFRNRKIQLLH